MPVEKRRAAVGGFSPRRAAVVVAWPALGRHAAMSANRLLFRARTLDAAKPMAVYMAHELPDLTDFTNIINRAVPQMPTGMEKEEETVDDRAFSLFPRWRPLRSPAILARATPDNPGAKFETCRTTDTSRFPLNVLLNVFDVVEFGARVVVVDVVGRRDPPSVLAPNSKRNQLQKHALCSTRSRLGHLFAAESALVHS